MNEEGKVLLRKIPCLALFLVNLVGRIANYLSRFTKENKIPQKINEMVREYVESSVKVPQII